MHLCKTPKAKDPNIRQALLDKVGPPGVKKAKELKPDLILMDVNMPDLDGFATARKLSQTPETKVIPVVFVTSKDQKVDRVFAQMLGAKGYVTKPYSADQILALL